MDYTALWRKLIIDPAKSWVVFSHGTCVVLTKPEKDLEAQAKALLAEWGPVQVGTPFGDFTVTKQSDNLGWIVGCHHVDILNHVGPQDTELPDMQIGILGRSMRDHDAKELNVVHIEKR